MNEQVKDWMQGYSFPVDGRKPSEVSIMKQSEYVEVQTFQKDNLRVDGYFCGSCGAFDSKPESITENPTKDDGFCNLKKFRDRSYGCCRFYYPNPNLRIS